MLVASLILSGVLLLAAILAARYATHPIRVTLGWAAAVTILPLFVLATFFPAVWVQAAALAVGLLICAAVGRRGRWISVASVASVLFAYGLEWQSARAEERRYEELRARYPFESLEDRLPRPVPASAAGDPKRLEQVEQALAQRDFRARGMALERLHTEAVSRFARTPGLGVGRMVNLTQPNEWNLRPDERDDAPPQQDYFRPSARADERPTPKPTATTLDNLHEQGVLDFVNPRGFGYFKDRGHVAGFQSHGFTRVPQPTEGWKVATVDLVGLLIHEKPVVYVSEKLPRMEELRNAPTRPLDGFESTALAALQKGVDLHTADGPDGVRFVGALRNAQQCTKCHDGDRGTLLGAFSYRLQPAK